MQAGWCARRQDEQGVGVVRVLVVDDFVPYLDAVHDLVSATVGFEPCGELTSGAQALAALDEVAPDLVLVDVYMPEMDGLEFTRMLRVAGSTAVVVLITADDPSQLPDGTLTCGADAVMSKYELGPARLRELWLAHSAGRGTR